MRRARKESSVLETQPIKTPNCDLKCSERFREQKHERGKSLVFSKYAAG